MSVEEDEEDQNENVDLVAGAWRRVGEPRGGAREREPLWTGSRPSNDPSCDSRLELARPIQTPQNRRAELQPRCLRQLRLRWRRRWRRLEAAADDCAEAGATVVLSRPDRPGNSKFRRRRRRPRPFGAALLGRFLPRLKAPASSWPGPPFPNITRSYWVSPLWPPFSDNCEPRHSRELKYWTSLHAPVSEGESGSGLKGRQAEKDRRWTISGASRTRSRA
jgi:hypothetical protein